MAFWFKEIDGHMQSVPTYIRMYYHMQSVPTYKDILSHAVRSHL